MDIRDGLSASQKVDFENCVSRLPELLAEREEAINDASSGGTLTAETLALTLLTFGSPDAARQYLQKPTSRLAGKTPLVCINDSEASCEMVIGDLFRMVEGYVF